MANEQAKRQYDKHTRPSIEYKPGDQVYIKAMNIKANGPSKKLNDKRFGPFKVLEKVKESSYGIDLPASWKEKQLIFNETYLTPYHSPKYCRQQKPPPPPPIKSEDSEQAWNVQEILDLKFHRKKIKYLVHWEGYTHDHDTWEPIENLDDTQECLKAFHRKSPNKPSHDHINVCAIDSSHEKFLFDPNTDMPGTHFIPPPEEIP
jgi:hypothetical protein